jgi:hypothetical protein
MLLNVALSVLLVVSTHSKRDLNCYGIRQLERPGLEVVVACFMGPY